VKRYDVVMVVMLFLVAGVPARAYGDPTGGSLFQILMPLLAGLWAMWMIFANRVRRGLLVFYRRLRGTEPEEPTV
jgi:hypothetical protein